MLIMEPSKLILRLASSNDAEKICLLFKKVAPEYDRKINFWVWINRMLSDCNSVISIAEYNGDIIGHYAIIPQKVIINDLEYTSGLGVHAVIQNGRNDLVSIYEISNLAYKEAKRLGFKFIYGFPNKNYRLIQEKIERWKPVDLFKSYEFDINDYKLDKTIEVFKISRLDNSSSSFFEIARTIDNSFLNSSIHIKKGLNYYCNRYINHPHSLYESYMVTDQSGNKANLFLKTFEDIHTGTIKGHLIDFTKQKGFSTKNILDVSISILKERNVNRMSFWPINIEIKNIFKMLKIEAFGFETFFGIKFLDKVFEKEFKEELLEIDNWTLHMGDSDAF